MVGTGREVATLKGMLTALTHQPVHHTPQPTKKRSTQYKVRLFPTPLSLSLLPLFPSSLLSSLLSSSLFLPLLSPLPPVDVPWRESFSLHGLEVVGDIPAWVSLMAIYYSPSTVYRQPGVCVCVCVCVHGLSLHCMVLS